MECCFYLEVCPGKIGDLALGDKDAKVFGEGFERLLTVLYVSGVYCLFGEGDALRVHI